MSIMGIIASLILFTLGVIWLAMPILKRERGVEVAVLNEQKRYDALLTTYERVVSTLRDLDEDYAVGKLSPAEYEAERSHWTERGVETLKALEASGSKRKQPTFKREPATTGAKVVRMAAADEPIPDADPDAVLDDAIEQAIASYIRARDNTNTK
jgi:hypothetical protein